LQLGRYQILKKLATGDVADVLLARATGLEGFARHVVIKCIRSDLAGEQRLVQAFLEEARIAASLHHQNIVQVHDIGEQDGAYFFAMEYVHGEDVRQLLAKVRERNEQVPLQTVVAIITATAAGLHHAHEQRNPAGEHLGLVHRDVCPANILLGYDGSVKLVDFGMAKAALRSQKTASGSLKGKASYMSPEQCMGKPVDRRTDTFALGIVLYELLTARRLFKGVNEFLTMAAIVEGAVPPPSSYRSDLPAALDEIAARALAREPQVRYQTAEDLRAALERFAIDAQLRTSNKALSDYFTTLFGQRLEPWHADSEVRALTADFDHSADNGLVAAPKANDEMIARYAPRSTSPIMLAQSLADSELESESDVDGEWTDDDEHVRTSARKPSQEDMAVLRPPAPPVLPPRADVEPTRSERRTPLPIPVQRPLLPKDDDPFGQTIVTPPSFENEESTAAYVEKAEEAAAVLASATGGGDEEDDEGASTLTGADDPNPRASTIAGVGVANAPPPRAASPASRARSPSPAEAMIRPQGEHVYVGPPAPRTPVWHAFIGTYRRSILVGAGAGVLAVVITALAVRSCRSHHATPSETPMVQPDEGTNNAPAANNHPPNKPDDSGSAR